MKAGNPQTPSRPDSSMFLHSASNLKYLRLLIYLLEEHDPYEPLGDCRRLPSLGNLVTGIYVHFCPTPYEIAPSQPVPPIPSGILQRDYLGQSLNISCLSRLLNTYLYIIQHLKQYFPPYVSALILLYR